MLVCSAAMGQTISPGSVVPHQFIVRSGGTSTVEQIASRYALSVVSVDSSTGSGVVASDGSFDDSIVLTEMGGDSEVSRVEQNRYLAVSEGNTQSFFVDVLPAAYHRQAALDLIGVTRIGSMVRGNGVVVAVLDTGVSPHYGLGVDLIPGYNAFLNNDQSDDVASGVDTNGDGVVDARVGHGTMVAGLVHLVAPGARILPIKVLDSDGYGDAYTIAKGIRYATSRGAQVINLSLSSPVDSHDIEEAIEHARERGIVIVASVANNGQRRDLFPASYHGVIAVTATDMNDHRAPFADYASYVDLCAPGVDVVGLLPDGRFGQASGTSFSAAMVSGAAALVVRSLGPSWSSWQVRNALNGGAVDIGSLNAGFSGLLGAGRLSLNGVVAPSCVTDLDDGSGTGTLDGSVDINDLLYYFARFESGDSIADFDDGSGLGVPDGAIGVEDLLFFMQAYERGC